MDGQEMLGEILKHNDCAVVFGNSGSGKSTLARALSSQLGMAHFDLDVIAWEPTDPPSRRDLRLSQQDLQPFFERYPAWVIEGCYSDLIETISTRVSVMIYLDLPLDACLENAQSRPWEPHKYPSKEAQDANLPMLLDWIKGYSTRNDTFSRSAHEKLFRDWSGRKCRLTERLSLQE